MARKQARSNVTKMKPGTRKRTGALGPLKSEKPTGRQPRSLVLPGHELVRDARLDDICSEIGEGLDKINSGAADVKDGKVSGLERMRELGLLKYHNAGVTIRFKGGADRLSVKKEKETLESGGEPKAPAKSEKVPGKEETKD